MKKLLIFTAILTIFVSCGKKTSPLVSSAKDSLETVIKMKDSLINEAFMNINDISSIVSQIAEREKLITKQSVGELSKTTKAQIAENLAAINQLLEENRARIATLQVSADRLRQANIQVDGLQSLIASLEKQQTEKDTQIESLTTQIRALNIQVADLQTSIKTLQENNEGLEQEVVTQTTALNTVYYIVGAERSLRSKGIVDKEGFIGRTRVVGSNTDLTDFTKADKRNIERIKIGGRRARIVTSHPEKSYMLVMGNRNVTEELVITDKDEFWKNSNILIISHR